MNLKTITKTKSKGASPIVGILLAMIIGVGITVPVVNQFTERATTIYSMTNDSRIDWNDTVDYDKELGGFGDGTDFTVRMGTFHIYNSTDCSSTEWTLHDHYNVTLNGTTPTVSLSVLSRNTLTPNYTCAVYDYYSTDQYLSGGISRTILSNIVPLIATGMIVIGASILD